MNRKGGQHMKESGRWRWREAQGRRGEATTASLPPFHRGGGNMAERLRPRQQQQEQQRRLWKDRERQQLVPTGREK